MNVSRRKELLHPLDDITDQSEEEKQSRPITIDWDRAAPTYECAIPPKTIEQRTDEEWSLILKKAGKNLGAVRKEANRFNNRLYTLAHEVEKRKGQLVSQTGFEGYKAGDMYYFVVCIEGRLARYEKEYMDMMQEQRRRLR